MRELVRTVAAVLGATLVAVVAGFVLWALAAVVGFAEPSVAVTETWTYRPAEAPLVHGLFGAIGLGGFTGAALGTLGGLRLALLAGVLGPVLGLALIAIAVGFWAMVLLDPFGLGLDQKGLLGGVGAGLGLLGASMVARGLRRSPPAR